MKSGSRLEQVEGVGHALAIALLEAIEDGEHGLELAGDDRVVELILVALEFGDVACKKVAARPVELFDEPIEHQGRHGVIDRRLPIVGAFDDVADQLADAPLALGRGEVLSGRGRDGLRDGRLSRAGEEATHEDQRGQTEEKRESPARGCGGGFVRGRLIHCFSSS